MNTFAAYFKYLSMASTCRNFERAFPLSCSFKNFHVDFSTESGERKRNFLCDNQGIAFPTKRWIVLNENFNMQVSGVRTLAPRLAVAFHFNCHSIINTSG